MDNVKQENINEKNMQRMMQLPDAYGAAIEEIMDNMDKDWQNRVVFSRYIADLCTIMEDGFKAGKSVEEITGKDIKAFARQFQEKVDYREVDATPLQKHINYLMAWDFLVFIGITPIRFAITNFVGGDTATIDYLFLAFGVICIALSFFMKAKRYQIIHLPFLLLAIQLIGIVAIGFITKFGYEMVIISFALCAGLDYFIGTKKAIVN